jgi:hypothetical protein
MRYTITRTTHDDDGYYGLLALRESCARAKDEARRAEERGERELSAWYDASAELMPMSRDDG